MKKLGFMGMAVVAVSVVLLTSCLKGENKYAGSDYGVITYANTGVASIIYPAYSRSWYPAPLYIKQIADDPSIKDNDCIQFTYEVNMENGANSNASASSYGFYTGTTTGFRIVESKSANYMTTDTARAMLNELTFNNADAVGFIYYKKRLVIATKPSKLLKDQKNSYELYCSLGQEPKLESVNGNSYRVYTMFLRATKFEDGKDPVIEAEDRAFDIKGFYDNVKNVETSKGEQAINFKIMYPKELSKDSLAVTTWVSTPVLSVAIEKEQ